VGLVTGACLAERGHSVTCLDRDAPRVAAIARGETPFHEPGLPALVSETVATGALAASTDLDAAVRSADVVMLCVGTPAGGDGASDLSALLGAARQVGRAIAAHPGRPVIVVKSTVPPGTTGGPVRQALEEGSGRIAGAGFGLAMNPEFLSQGSAVTDFLNPDRIVIGALDEDAADTVAALYRGFRCPMPRTTLVNAELIKYAANALQATLISYANQIGAICERIEGADERAVMAAVHLDRMLDGPDGSRAGAARFLRAGIGFGGSCFPKDLAALRHIAAERGAPTHLLDGVLATNVARVDEMAQRLDQALGGLEGRRIAVLGLAFKPHTDDLRESPGLRLIAALEARGAHVNAHDPMPAAMEGARAGMVNGTRLCATVEDALGGADAAVIATAWPQYRQLDWPGLAGLMATPVILDGRDLLNGQVLRAPILFHRVGTGPAPASTIVNQQGKTA